MRYPFQAAFCLHAKCGRATILNALVARQDHGGHEGQPLAVFHGGLRPDRQGVCDAR